MKLWVARLLWKPLVPCCKLLMLGWQRPGTPEGLVQPFNDKVPWLPCVNFRVVPKNTKKGTVHVARGTRGTWHISMLSHRPCLFVGDAKLLLENGSRRCCWSRSQGSSVVNIRNAFALSYIIASHCVCNNCAKSQPLARLLQSIPVQFTQHETLESRLLQHQVDSTAMKSLTQVVVKLPQPLACLFNSYEVVDPTCGEAYVT